MPSTASTIHAQIPTSLKMAVGYRRPVDLVNGLQFDCRGRQTYRVLVSLDEARDLYDVRVYVGLRLMDDVRGLYVDQMVGYIDGIDRGTNPPKPGRR